MKKSKSCEPPLHEADLPLSGLSDVRLDPEEVYLFHPSDPRCPAATSLWGQFDRRTDRGIVLETATTDLVHFRLRLLLPTEYRYCRLSSRTELRDYVCSQLWAEWRLNHS